MTPSLEKKPITMTTWLGHEIDLRTGPRPEQCKIEDIAHSLSLICRYGGHANRFYSVAEHAVLCARHMMTMHGVYVLHHDDGEFITNDMTWPMKVFIFGEDYHNNPLYRKTMGKFDKPILEALGLNYEAFKNLYPTIKKIEGRVQEFEVKYLRGRNAPAVEEFPEDDPLFGAEFGMSPVEAEAAFLRMHKTFMGS